MTVTHANPLSHCRPGMKCVHYMELPGRYRLPLRIDMTAKIDSPALYVLLGEGHVNLGDYWSNRRLDDICEPHRKVTFFDNHLTMGQWNDISLIYDLKEMQIVVNGEERYWSKREKYMRSPLFEQMNAQGFPFKISCGKRTEVEVQSLQITECDGTAGIVRLPVAEGVQHAPPPKPGKKPDFAYCLSGLTEEQRAAVADMDGWLKALSPIKFKRTIDSNGTKISYVASDEGFSYAIHPGFGVLYHTLQWYILTQGKPEKWGRKADRMEGTLNHLAQTDPAFARRMFENLYECVGGFGGEPVCPTPYAFEGKKKVACHGKMWFKMNLSEFEDVKRFIGAVNELARR